MGEDEGVRNHKLSIEAIAAKHAQLLEEDLLPALRPEVVLSPDQLSALCWVRSGGRGMTSSELINHCAAKMSDESIQRVGELP